MLMTAAVTEIFRRVFPSVKTAAKPLPDATPTRYEIARVDGDLRYQFVFESPCRLISNGKGEYDDVAGTVQMRIEWSADQNIWSFYRFQNAPCHESRTPDGRWVYRAISDVIVTEHNSQFARLCILTIRRRPRRGLDLC
jgi:hypothetical protein